MYRSSSFSNANKIMLNNEDTLRFRQHCQNFAWNFFRTCDTKIVIKFQHQHEIRSGLQHSIPKTCKMMLERANLHRPTVLARCARIYPGLQVSWYILYFINWNALCSRLRDKSRFCVKVGLSVLKFVQGPQLVLFWNSTFLHCGTYE